MFYCEIKDEIEGNTEHREFKKTDIVSIEIGLDFGGNKSGHAFVARGYTDDYKEVVGVMSRRIMLEDYPEGIDSKKLTEIFLGFVQEVIDKYAVTDGRGEYIQYCNVETVYFDNAESVLGASIRNNVETRYPWMSVKPAKKKAIIDRIRCTQMLMGAGRFFLTEDCESLETAFCDAVYDKESLEDERLDDGSTDIDSLDAFEYTIERDMKYLIDEE